MIAGFVQQSACLVVLGEEAVRLLVLEWRFSRPGRPARSLSQEGLRLGIGL